MKSFVEEDTGSIGFQIAPMVDVVFVIMLFFMVMAGAVKVENHHLDFGRGRGVIERGAVRHAGELRSAAVAGDPEAAQGERRPCQTASCRHYRE